MTQELMYTSAPQGLKPGSRGFCTVVTTQGMPINLAERLESLSGYRHVFQPSDPRAEQNPIVFSHLRLTVGGQLYHVLSRICPAGVDYSQRANKFAHHVVLHPGELPAVGPAWLLTAPGFMASSWDGRPRVIASGRPVPQGQVVPAPCDRWRDLTGDAGWAGVLLASAMGKPPHPVILVFRPTMEMLPLIAEVLALLPPEMRWNVTFNTYYTGLPVGIECLWRCVLEGTPEAAAARRTRGATVIDLCQQLGAPPESEFAEAARQGQAIRLPSAPTVPELAAPLRMEALSDGLTTAPLPRTDLESHHRPSVYSAAPSPLSDELPTPPKVRLYGMAPKRRRRWPLIAAGITAAVLLLAGAGVAFWMASEGRQVVINGNGTPHNPVPPDNKTPPIGEGAKRPEGKKEKQPGIDQNTDELPKPKPPDEKTKPEDPPKTNTGQTGSESPGTKSNGNQKGTTESSATEQTAEANPKKTDQQNENAKSPTGTDSPGAKPNGNQDPPKDSSATGEPPKEQPEQPKQQPGKDKPPPKASPQFIFNKYVQLPKPPLFNPSTQPVKEEVEIATALSRNLANKVEFTIKTPDFVGRPATGGSMFVVKPAEKSDKTEWQVRLVQPDGKLGISVATLEVDADKLFFSWSQDHSVEGVYAKLVWSVLVARVEDHGEHVVQFIKPSKANPVRFDGRKRHSNVLLETWEIPAAWPRDFKQDSLNLQAELTVKLDGKYDTKIKARTGRQWDMTIQQTKAKFRLRLDLVENNSPSETPKLELTAADAPDGPMVRLFGHDDFKKFHGWLGQLANSIDQTDKRIADLQKIKKANEERRISPPLAPNEQEELDQRQKTRDSLANLKQSLKILDNSTIQIKEVYYEFSPSQNSGSSSQEQPKKYRVYLIAEPGHEIFHESPER